MAKRGIIGILLAAAVVLVVVLFIFDSHLLSERCDHQVHVLTAEKQRASRHIKELQQALAKSSEMLEKIRVGKAGASASSLHSQLNALTADAGGGVKPRRRARQSPPPSPNPPPPSPARAAEQISAAAPVQAAAGFSLLTPGRIAVVVIAYNRPRCHREQQHAHTRTPRVRTPLCPHGLGGAALFGALASARPCTGTDGVAAPAACRSYLDRALKSIYLHHPGGNSFPVFVSQDGENADVAAVVTRHGARRIVHPRKAVKLKTGTYLAKFPGYAYLSLHYGWALGTLFADADAYEGVIILEEDIEVAPGRCPHYAVLRQCMRSAHAPHTRRTRCAHTLCTRAAHAPPPHMRCTRAAHVPHMCRAGRARLFQLLHCHRAAAVPGATYVPLLCHMPAYVLHACHTMRCAEGSGRFTPCDRVFTPSATTTVHTMRR